MTNAIITGKRAVRFQKIFTGLDRCHGRYNQGRARTVRKRASLQSYRKHLEGTIGLGIVPIKENARCCFAAIDIDDHEVDHAALERRIKELGLPLIICRSKSGGAHLYTFYKPDGELAPIIRRNLSEWGAALGFGTSEIFPKQDRLVDKDDLGNWINLPYYNAASTNRFMVENGKPASLPRFLDAAESIATIHDLKEENRKEVSTNDIKDHEGFTPCIQAAIKEKIPLGQRNEMLFNVGVFLKRKYGEPEWENQLSNFNLRYCEKPIPNAELQRKIIKSVNRKDYSFKCNEPFAKSHCDRLRCQQLKFGVGKVEYVYHELSIGRLLKICTDPPKWVLDFAGLDVTISTEQLENYKRIRTIGLEKLNKRFPPMKPADWDQVLKKLLESVEEIEAPEDASKYGHLYNLMDRYFANARNGDDRTKVKRGIPVIDRIKDQPAILFTSSGVMEFLKRQKFSNITMPDLFAALRKMGVKHKKMKIEGKSLNIWYTPVDEPLKKIEEEEEGEHDF